MIFRNDETKIFEDDQDGSADDKMEEFLISVGQSKEYAKETKDSYGTFVVDADGKEILVINKASALSGRVVTTGQHEFLHKFLKSSLSSKPELVQQAGELLLKEILASSSSSSNIVARIESYATDDKITVDKFFEEILPLFSEALTNKEIKLNESSITKIQDFFRRVFQNLGLKDIRFDKAEGVANFIKDYNKAYSKGSFKGSLKALAGKDGDGKVSGVSLSKSVSELNTELEDLKDRDTYVIKITINEVFCATVLPIVIGEKVFMFIVTCKQLITTIASQSNGYFIASKFSQ